MQNLPQCPVITEKSGKIKRCCWHHCASYLLSTRLDGSIGCRAGSHFTLLCLCSKLQTNDRGKHESLQSLNIHYTYNFINCRTSETQNLLIIPLTIFSATDYKTKCCIQTEHTRPTLLRSNRLNGLEETASVWMKFFSTSEDVVWM